MPNWRPNPQNVRWDHAAASQAINALRRAADELERTANERRQAADQARTQWRGVHRTTFDIHLDQTIQRARALAQEYREAATRIMQANDRAREEQAQRLRDRARWQQEKEAEDRERRQRESQQRR